uniref:Uncharacterized protein n=1 Tax=Photinus pyralis TaxID=7054 RepID=A0A1Y1JUJ0_PHOPY
MRLSLTAVDFALKRDFTLKIDSSGGSKGSSSQSRRCTRSSAVGSLAKHSCANSGIFSSVSIGNMLLLVIRRKESAILKVLVVPGRSLGYQFGTDSCQGFYNACLLPRRLLWKVSRRETHGIYL